MKTKKETKDDTFRRVRSGDIFHADVTDPRPRVRRAAMVAALMMGTLEADGVQRILDSAAKDESPTVHLSVHRAYLRALTA